MSLTFSISINTGQIDAFNNALKTLYSNYTNIVPEAIGRLMTQARNLAFERTHKITGRLAGAWKYQRTANTFSLFNPTPYATTEFSRGGVKVRGKPPLGTPHNVIPQIADLISNNLESTVSRALLNGLPR